MIETTIPEIDVSDLMQRVRAKLEQTREAPVRPKAPPIAQVKEIASAILPAPVTLKTEQILRAAQSAREAITVSRWIPKPLRRLFRRQDKFDREVLRAIEWLGNTNVQFADRLRHLTACAEVADHGLHHLAELRRADGEWMSEMIQISNNDGAWMQGAERLLTSIVKYRRKLAASTDAFAQQISALDQKMDSKLLALAKESGRFREQITSFEERIGAVIEQVTTAARQNEELSGRSREQIMSFEERIGAVMEQVTTAARQNEELSGHFRDQIMSFEPRIGSVIEQMTTVAHHNEELSIQTNKVHTEHNALAEHVRSFRSEFESAAEHLRHLQVQADLLNKAAQDLQRELAGRAEPEEYSKLRRDVELVEQRQTSDAAFIKAELSRQSELVHKLIRPPAGRGSAKNSRNANVELIAGPGHRLDAFYFSFENHFRGPRGEIKQRQRFYLPIVENCGAGSQGRPIVDLGCGRGEWLELLREQNRSGTGVDVNQTMIDQCKERNLDVVQGDALDFLRALPDNSQGAVTGFHIIEHLPLDTLVDIIAETYRVLHPGGLVIFESPNCKNLTVGACNFYIDPTHRNPVFPETAQFMLETNGFERVSLEYLCPDDITEIDPIIEQGSRLRELLYGPRDFGVIGYKPERHMNVSESER
jgi:SAM-dependent methyltransferase/uncharacterized coiled-coil DUF342 family protein